jgi:DNA-binding NarL/FixJ family response regulator
MSVTMRKPVMPCATARIMIVDDNAPVRAGIRALLTSRSSFEICGEAASGREAVEKVQELHPDLLVLDYLMPGMNGLEAAREIRSLAPDVRIVMFTMHESPEFAALAEQAGADAVVTKSGSALSLIDAVNRVLDRRSGI